jgi:hypothetical protein
MQNELRLRGEEGGSRRTGFLPFSFISLSPLSIFLGALEGLSTCSFSLLCIFLVVTAVQHLKPSCHLFAHAHVKVCLGSLLCVVFVVLKKKTRKHYNNYNLKLFHLERERSQY